MKNMGNVNSNMVQCIVPYLLHLHPYFDTPEPDINDPACKRFREKLLNLSVSIFMIYRCRSYSVSAKFCITSRSHSFAFTSSHDETLSVFESK